MRIRDELRAIEDMVSRDVFLPSRKVPTFEEVRKQCIEFKKPKLRETTCEAYETNAKHHLKELDGLRVTQITPAVVEKFIATMQKKHKMIRRKGSKKTGDEVPCAFSEKMISLQTVKKVLALPHQVIAYAVRHRLIDNNPVRDAERPRSQGKESQKKQTLILTLFLTAIMTGARQGEILGLELKSGGRDKDLLFPNEAGQPLNDSNMVQRYFLKALKEAKIPRVRFHELRHSYASLLLSHGENIKYIQHQLGHSSPMVTLNIYSHLLKDSNQEAACRLENAIYEVNGCKMVADEEKGATAKTATP